jgi:MFS superfamily sulfate permease-like transporter
MSTDNRFPQYRAAGDEPRGDWAGFAAHASSDIVSGFLVFLIALPLCLGIALAYGYPPIAGVFTAVIGGILSAMVSDSELTIKGPAAGLIVIAAGCVMDFGGSGIYDPHNPAAVAAYRAALAVGVVAGVLQILFGAFRVGILGEFFPLTIVHGMLAAIGVIIIAKQLPPTFGVTVKGEPIPLLLGMPRILANHHFQVAMVGATSLLIMFAWPVAIRRLRALRSIPAALVVLLVTIPMGRALNLSATQTNHVSLESETAPHADPVPLSQTHHLATIVGTGSLARVGATSAVSSPAGSAASSRCDTLVQVPRFGETFRALTFPDFTALKSPKAWKWVIMFALIGTIESMLTAKAIDLFDPYKRTTNLDRDNLAVGVANTVCALIGAAPMISEIARSKANIDNGAKTRFANLWHAVFLLAFVSLLPFVISTVPIASLSAMLVYTGFRLAHPREFVHMLQIGKEQLLLFGATIVGVLATDLLVGIAIGIVLKMVIELMNGVPVRALFVPTLIEHDNGDRFVRLETRHAVIFSNWIAVKRRVDRIRTEQRNLLIDLSQARVVDHTVIRKLHELKRDFAQDGLEFDWTGMENHRSLSSHPQAVRILAR